MKKVVFLFLILIFSLFGCERDDICIDPITPNLILRFYDAEDIESFKSVNNLMVEVTISTDSVYKTQVSGDSIVIPIRIDQDITEYQLSLVIENDTIPDNLTLLYNRAEEIVGRSCGFRSIFNNVSLEKSTSGWIQNFQLNENPLNITDETSAHVKIFH